MPRPAWVSPELYPFESRFFETAAGAMHYIDVGEGKPIVFVHGNPSWSFEFRALIRQLGDSFRCVAPDHIGFGLSSKSAPDKACHPRDHAARLRALIEHLGLEDITLVLTDFGGPIGLDFAVARPERVSRIVLFNTWAWPVNGDLHCEVFSRSMGGPVGQCSIRYFNALVNVVLPTMVGRKEVLTKEVMDHYRGPLRRRKDRRWSAALPNYILAARPWLEDIWGQRDKFIDKPILVVWGGADVAMRAQELNVWKRALRNATFHSYENVGHVVAEEIPDIAARHIREFLAPAPMIS